MVASDVLSGTAYPFFDQCYHCETLKVPLWPGDVNRLGIHHIRQTAAKGCSACTLFESIIDHIWKHHYPEESLVHFELLCVDQGLYLCVTQSGVNSGIDDLFEISTLIEQPCPSVTVPVRKLTSGGMSLGDATSQITQWLTDCVYMRHAELTNYINFCQHADTSPQPLPTRIISIENHQEVRLYSANLHKPDLAHYACLSHRWGKDDFIQTKSSNIHAYSRSIPWNCLPLTFQDAIEVTWRLGLRYLWVDSLCIIQDDREDWRHEGSKMAATYSRAYITLAATAAMTPSQGLFLRHPRQRGEQCLRERIDLPYNFALCVAAVPRSVLEPPHTWPLLNRAWVFQERYLSPRTVHFAGDELFWECRSLGTCECDSSTKKFNPKVVHHQDFPLTRQWKNSPHDPDFMAMRNWYRIVEEYSRLQLTYADDIFPALQGIASLMQEKRLEGYYAGLWEGTLLYDLLWKGTSLTRTVDMGRAPSWSWASEVGPVEFLRTDPGHTVAASVISITTTPVGNDPLGAISGGTLQLKGRCIEIDDTAQFSFLKHHHDIPVMVMELFYSMGSSFCIVLEAVDHSRYKRIDLNWLRHVSPGLIYTDMHVLLEREGAVRTLTIV